MTVRLDGGAGSFVGIAPGCFADYSGRDADCHSVVGNVVKDDRVRADYGPDPDPDARTDVDVFAEPGPVSQISTAPTRSMP